MILGKLFEVIFSENINNNHKYKIEEHIWMDYNENNLPLFQL